MKKQNEAKNNESSDDSSGEDYSYDEERNDSPEPNRLDCDSLKNKYNAYKYSKTKYLSKPNWNTIYNCFFLGNSNKIEKTSLSELEMRCKLLYKIDEYEKKNKNINHTLKNDLSSHSNIIKIIDKYSKQIVYDKPSKHPNKNQTSKNFINEDHIQNNAPKIERMISIVKGFRRSISANPYFTKPKSIIAKFSKLDDEKESKNYSDAEIEMDFSKKKSHKRNMSLLELYNIKDTPYITPQTNRKGKEKKISQFLDDENYNNLLNNKNAYKVEIDNYKSCFSKTNKVYNGNNLNEFEHLINFLPAENYFEGQRLKRNKNNSSLKFNGNIEQLDVFAKKINRLHNKYIDKLDSNKKFII